MAVRDPGAANGGAQALDSTVRLLIFEILLYETVAKPVPVFWTGLKGLQGGTLRAFRSMFYTGTVVQLVSVAVHFLGMSLKHDPASGQEKMLDDLMRNYRFDLGAGFVRTMSDFLTGFGLILGVFTLFLGLINLFAIHQARDSRFLKSLCWLNALCMAIVSVIAFKFFFLPPFLFAFVPFLAFLGAALAAPRQA